MSLVKVVIAKDYNQHNKGKTLEVDAGRAKQWAKDGIIESGESANTAKRSKSADRKPDVSSSLTDA